MSLMSLAMIRVSLGVPAMACSPVTASAANNRPASNFLMSSSLSKFCAPGRATVLPRAPGGPVATVGAGPERRCLKSGTYHPDEAAILGPWPAAGFEERATS